MLSKSIAKQIMSYVCLCALCQTVFRAARRGGGLRAYTVQAGVCCMVILVQSMDESQDVKIST